MHLYNSTFIYNLKNNIVYNYSTKSYLCTRSQINLAWFIHLGPIWPIKWQGLHGTQQYGFAVRSLYTTPSLREYWYQQWQQTPKRSRWTLPGTVLLVLLTVQQLLGTGKTYIRQLSDLDLVVSSRRASSVVETIYYVDGTGGSIPPRSILTIRRYRSTFPMECIDNMAVS